MVSAGLGASTYISFFFSSGLGGAKEGTVLSVKEGAGAVAVNRLPVIGALTAIGYLTFWSSFNPGILSVNMGSFSFSS
jgi:hypothetical protein